MTPEDWSQAPEWAEWCVTAIYGWFCEHEPTETLPDGEGK